MQISLKNLSCGYKNIVLKNISLTFNSGDWIFFIGPTGTGKSTLLQTIGGIIPKKSGEILVETKNFRDEVGIMFQYTDKQFFNPTVKDEIIFVLKYKKVATHIIEKKLKEICNLLLISDEFLEKSPFELSGGQKRIIALASILINDPKLLILDEPTVGLDIESQELFFSILKDLNAKGITILQSSHSLEEVAEYGDEVVVISKKDEVLYGKPDQILLSREILAKAELEPPEILNFYENFDRLGIKLKRTCKFESFLKSLLEVENGTEI